MKKIILLIIIQILLIPYGKSQQNFSGLTQYLKEKRMALGGNAYTMIYHQGKIIYRDSLGTYNQNSRELIASCSKWLTAALAMTFIEEGKLNLDDPVAKYLPEFNTPEKNSIKIWQCLSHTTGIHSEPVTLVSIMKRRHYKSLQEEVEEFSKEPMAGVPGKVFAYSSIGLNIAGRVLEKISGKDFETLFQERIAGPLNMTHTSFAGRNAADPSGGARSTPSDYMHFLEMILNDGVYHGKRILTHASLEQMEKSETDGIKVLYTPDQAEGFEYGFGEWIQKKDSDGKSMVISSPGLFGSYPCIDLSKKYAVLVFVKNLRNKGRKELYLTMLDLINRQITL